MLRKEIACFSQSGRTFFMFGVQGVTSKLWVVPKFGWIIIKHENKRCLLKGKRITVPFFPGFPECLLVVSICVCVYISVLCSFLHAFVCKNECSCSYTDLLTSLQPSPTSELTCSTSHLTAQSDSDTVSKATLICHPGIFHPGGGRGRRGEEGLGRKVSFVFFCFFFLQDKKDEGFSRARWWHLNRSSKSDLHISTSPYIRLILSIYIKIKNREIM